SWWHRSCWCRPWRSGPGWQRVIRTGGGPWLPSELRLQLLDRRGAGRGRLVPRHLADGRGDVVGGAVDGLGDRAGRVLQRGGDLAPGLALQDLRAEAGPADHVLVPDVDERDGALVGRGAVGRGVALVQQRILGRRRGLQ